MELIIDNICKTLDKITVLDHICLKMVSYKAYGIVGRNGSGKSILFKILSGLVVPESGVILVDNEVMDRTRLRSLNIGLIIENAGLHESLNAFDNLKSLATINNYIGNDEIKDAINRVGLDSNDKRKIKKYSLGMKRRLVLAQAIMEKPDILILDEPTNGLDEASVRLFTDIMQEEKMRGALIVMTSHIKEDVLSVCDETYIISEGKIQ